jgi:hypothetical protein
VVLPGGNPATSNAQLQIPSCSYICTDTNGPVNGGTVPVNNQSNPYLPPFDTYYAMKNPQCNKPVQDQNQKHFVIKCNQCPGEAPVPIGAFMPVTPYTIEPPSGPEASFYYPLCPGGGDIPLPSLPEGANIPVFPVIVGGQLPLGGQWSIQISPLNTSINPTLLLIDPSTGAIQWPSNSGNLGS